MNWILCGPCRLKCPPGMAQATTFCGLMGTEEEVSVMVQELPAPVAKVRPAMRPAMLESRGMFLLGQESTQIAGAEGLLLHVSQPREDQTFLKWVGVTGDERRTILITAVFPQEVSPAWSAALRDVVLTAESAGADAQASTAGAGSVQVEPPFALACQFQGESIYTPQGTFPLPKPTDPLFTVARGWAAVDQADRAQYAEERARRLEGAGDLEIESVLPVVVDGLDGFQLLGQTQGGPQPLFVCLTMLFGEQEYFVLVGMSTALRRAELSPLFRRMAASFRRDHAHETH